LKSRAAGKQAFPPPRAAYTTPPVIGGSSEGDEGIAAWLDFLTSGFHPDKRPEELRRAFPYEIPE
jgi:hypothetical protein